MTKQTKLILGTMGVVLGIMLAYFMLQTLNSQHDTQKQLEDLRRQMAAASAPATAPVAGAVVMPPPSTPSASTIPDNSALSRQKGTQEYLAEGFRLLNRRTAKDAAQATLLFREAIDKVDAKNVYFYSGLGRALLLQGQYAEALKVFETAQKIDPKMAELVSGSGWAYWDMKQYAAAKQAWERSLKLDPESEDAWMALAWIYMALGEFDKSMQGFVVLSNRDRNNPEWGAGLTMARAKNHYIEQIRVHFPGLPDPALFTAPIPASEVAPAPAGAASRP